MKRLLLAALGLSLAACPPTPPTPEEDAGEPAPVVYDGPTTNGGVPDLADDFGFDASFPAIDSGVIVVDTTCCTTHFSISDQEPADGVEGVLSIELPTFAQGVALARDGGRWHATACFPVNTGAAYGYRFTHDAGVADAGLVELEDGGVEGLFYIDVQVTQRASAEEPGFALADGTRTNFYRSVPDCAGLDGSVP